jgi:hypothetical protein
MRARAGSDAVIDRGAHPPVTSMDGPAGRVGQCSSQSEEDNRVHAPPCRRGLGCPPAMVRERGRRERGACPGPGRRAGYVIPPPPAALVIYSYPLPVAALCRRYRLHGRAHVHARARAARRARPARLGRRHALVQPVHLRDAPRPRPPAPGLPHADRAPHAQRGVVPDRGGPARAAVRGGHEGRARPGVPRERDVDRRGRAGVRLPARRALFPTTPHTHGLTPVRRCW